jgi:glycosyltransferase involved in cell wall biosynthesis
LPVRIAGAVQAPDGVARATTAVELLGELAPDALAAELACAAIFAAPARYEPFGQAVLEAALAGCALVVGDIASLREVWGDAAVFVDPDDHDALHAAIAALIDDRRRCRKLGAAARARALAFSPHRMVDAYVAAYRRIVPRFAADSEAVAAEVACAS